MTDTVPVPAQRASILAKVAQTYGLAPANLHETLAQTIFPTPGAANPAQVQALLIVADQYQLNPFTKELYAFPAKGGGVVPVVSVDGWMKLMNNHAAMDGIEIICNGQEGVTPTSYTARIYRKDRRVPVEVTEHYGECKRNTPPWRDQPHRMLRHRAVIQCIRVAFGFSGIYHDDEAARFAAAVPAELAEDDAGDPMAEALAQAQEPEPDIDALEQEAVRQENAEPAAAGIGWDDHEDDTPEPAE